MNTVVNNWQQLLTEMIDVPIENILQSNSLPDTKQTRFTLWRSMLSNVKSLFLNASQDDKKKMLQIFRKRFPSYRNQSDSQIEPYVINALDYIGNNPNRSQYFQLQVVGVRKISLYHVHTMRSQQTILVLGERHTSPAHNADKILKTLVSNLNCPIDIVVERIYESGHVIIQGNNLISFFTSEPTTRCFQRGKVPKQQQIQQSTDYYKTCIEPYEGKIKMWGIDIRRMSWFKWFLFIQYSSYQQAIKNDKELLQMTKQMFLQVLDYDLYLQDPLSYDNIIREKYNQVFQYFISKFTISGKDEFVNRFNSPQHIRGEKDHMKLMESLHFLNYDSAKYICSRISIDIEQSFDTAMFVRYFSDIYCFLRICRLVRQDRNRMILCFIGAQHVEIMHDFFIHCSLAYPTDTSPSPVIQYIGGKEYTQSVQTSLMLKKLPSFQSQRMLYYKQHSVNN